MGRRARNVHNDSRDWLTRASEDRAAAEKLPEGPARDEAIKKSDELRSAAEMMGYLRATDVKPSR